MEPHVLLTLAHRRRSLREIAIQKVPLRNSAVSLLHRHVASVLRIDYMSNTWNLRRAILCQYVTENVIDTGGCCGRRKALLPGRVPHVRPSVHGPKTESSNAFTACATILALGRSPRLTASLERATPRLFGPCTLGRSTHQSSREASPVPRHSLGHTLRIRFARRGRVIVFAPGGDLAA
jgi:hypothetical protein